MKFKSDKRSLSVDNDKSVITSVKDALTKKMTLACEFKDETGTSTKSYIKDGAIRVNSNQNGASASNEIIMKDKKMYVWDLKTKQGFVYDIPDSDSNTLKTIGSKVNQSDSYLNMIDKYKDSCKPIAVEDSYFTPPADIKFQDMTNLLENFRK